MKTRFLLSFGPLTILLLVETAILSTQLQSTNAALFPALKNHSNPSVAAKTNNTSSSSSNTTTSPSKSLKIVVLSSVSNQNSWSRIENLTSHGFEIKSIVPIQEAAPGKPVPVTKYVVILEAKS